MKRLKKPKFIFFIIVFTIILFYIGLVFFNYNVNKSMMEDLAKSNQINIVKGYKKKIDEWLHSKKLLIQSTANFLSSLSPTKETETIFKQLDLAVKSGDFRSVYVGYEDDTFISGIRWIGSNDYYATQRPWYKFTKEANSTIVTLPYIDSDLLQDVISIATPIRRDGEFIGVLSSDLILDVIAKDILTINLPVNGFAFLLNKRGNILVSPYGFNREKCLGCEPAIKVILEQKGDSKTLSYEHKHERYLLTYESLENTDWIFATVLNEKDIFTKLNQKLFANVLTALGFIFIGSIIFTVFMFMTKKLFRHKQLLDSFAHGGSQALAMINAEGKIVFVNKSYKKIFGLFDVKTDEDIYTIPHVFKQTSLDITPIVQDLVDDICNKHILQKSKKITCDEPYEFWKMEVTGIWNNYKHFEGAIITLRDVSHEHTLEEREKEHEQIMIQHGKMAALGEMVGAIVHQWRQPLAALLVMMGNMKYQVNDKIITQEKLISNFEKASDIIRFMEETLQSFKEFYKINNNKECFDIADTIHEIVNIMDPMARVNNIDLRFKYDFNEDYRLYAQSNHLKQVIVNLISNAKDAIISIRDNQDVQGHITITLTKDKSYCLLIEDDGCGISEDFKQFLFKPLKTTKGVNGTGNGLYLCQLLINTKLKGNIEVVSYKNPTRFKITLPKGDTDGRKECS